MRRWIALRLQRAEADHRHAQRASWLLSGTPLSSHADRAALRARRRLDRWLEITAFTNTKRGGPDVRTTA